MTNKTRVSLKKAAGCLFIACSVFYVVTAQTFIRTNWERSYNINASDKISAIVKVSNGNFILAGETTSPNEPGQKILIIKISPDGELIWQNTFGGKADCKFKSVSITGTDDILILGTKQQGSAKPLIWLMKIDKDGKLTWENTAGGGDGEFMSDLCETSDGGVFLCGSKIIKGNHDSDGWLIRYNRRGSFESQTMYGSRFINDEFTSIIPDKNSGFLVAGYTSEKTGSEKIPYILHIDFRGNKVWERSYPAFPGAIPSALYFNQEGLIGCFLNVYDNSGDFTGITKMLVDVQGSVISSYNVKRPLNISKNSFSLTGDDHIVLLSVQSDDPSAFSDKFIMKLDKALNPLWINPLEKEFASLKAIHSIDGANFLTAGWAGRTSYRNEVIVSSFHDHSVQLIDSYVKQKMVAIAGMNMDESIADFKARTGNMKVENYIQQFSSEAVTDLRLLPEAYIANTQTGSETRPAIMASVNRNTDSGKDIALTGKYYALLIAVNDYRDPLINDLDKPISDAQKLFDVLVNEYLFEKSNVSFLKNPTREQIISTLDRMEREITRSDNLLIFYAGHGFWNETTQKGFWLPSDASKQNTANWIGNSTISDYIRSIPAKHTLLIADACFSGSIFKTRSAFSTQDVSTMRLYELTSRKAMTSGTLTEVPDKSVFIDFLVKRLYENKENLLPSEQLFFSFKPAVLNNTETIPQYGVVGNSGDEGGDFIFMKRNK